MSGKYKKHGRGKLILKNADKIQGQGRVNGEEKACLAPSKYENMKMRVGALLERLVNKAPPVQAQEWNPGDIYSSEREHERSLER